MINNNRSETIAPTKNNDKVAEVRKELSVLGEEKEKLVRFIKEHKEEETKLTSLKDEVALVSGNVDKLMEEEKLLIMSINGLSSDKLRIVKNGASCNTKLFFE